MICVDHKRFSSWPFVDKKSCSPWPTVDNAPLKKAKSFSATLTRKDQIMILQISVQTNVNLLTKKIQKKLPRTSGVTKNKKLKTKNY